MNKSLLFIISQVRYLVFAALLSLFCVYANGQILINEFSASNSMLISDPDFGDYSDWIELYNAGTETVNLNGYYLSDNYNSPSRFTITGDFMVDPDEHIIIWADGRDTALHASFKLSSLGEQIGIYASVLGVVDTVSFVEQMTDISYGRKTDGNSEWAYFETPTPGTSNTTTSYQGMVYNQADFSVRGGMYSSSQEVILSTFFEGDIRYTRDGSTPNKFSSRYLNPISINETTILRARIFRPNLIAGPIVSHSYFINEHTAGGKLPVVSLSTDPDNFWHTSRGIYALDYKPSSEVPVNIELFENNGSDRAAFNEQVGVKINGLYSWQLPQKMLGVYFNKAYGSGNLEYPIIHQRKRSSYKNFALRASGSDWSYTLFRDILGQHSTLMNMDIDIMGFRPCVVYINGEYLGIHNIREKVNDDYIEKSYGLEEGTFDMVENLDYAEAGDLNEYNHLLTLLAKDLSSTDNYKAVTELVDIENFTDYVITELSSANYSISHNVMAWKPKGSGKWRWILMDLDRGYFEPADHLIDFYENQEELLLEVLLENSSYRQYFAHRLATQMFTSFNPERMKQLIREHTEAIESELPWHINRWQGTTSAYGDAIPSLSFWRDEVENLRIFVCDRPAEVLNDLQAYDFNEVASLSLATSPADGGIIKLNEIDVPGSSTTGHYVKGMTMHLEAIANHGHTFLGWIRSIENEIIPKESTWKYHDQGSDLGSSWRNPEYNDDSWDSGEGQLGYGELDENTRINYGSSSNRYITTYFRKTFTVTQAEKNANQFLLKLLKDDGAIVYLNGEEIIRTNMDGGDVDYRTRAAHSISNGSEDLYTTYRIDGSLITSGENLLSVELHQNSSSSSDLSFDLEFSAYLPDNSSYFSTEEELSLLFPNDMFLSATYNEVSNCILPDLISENMTLGISCSPYFSNGDILITENAIVTVDPGVEIRMSEGANIFVEGTMNVNGTAQSGVLIKINPADYPGSWGVISFKNTSEPSSLSFLCIEDASEGPDPILDKAAISAFNADLILDHITIVDVRGNPISARYSDITLTNSRLHSEVMGDLINVKYGTSRIEDCDFLGNDQADTDAIDYDDIENGIIKNCRISNFYGFNSDAIDIGENTSNVLIDSIFAYNITDKGVSLGQQSTATISNSVFMNCNMGVALKDSSRATIEHCLFYSNVQAVASFEKNRGKAGGNGLVRNSILSNSSSAPFLVDSESTLKIRYCLSDDEPLPEDEHNLNGNPLFSSPNYFNFELLPLSSARGSGYSTEGPIDMGVQFPSDSFEPSVMIYQFFINGSNYLKPEFIALYNPSSKKINVSNYMITKGIDIILPEETFLDPHGRLYVTSDRSSNIWGQNTYRKYEWTAGRLDNSGEDILLRDKHGIVIDYIEYMDDGLWPVDGFTGNNVFQLIDPGFDNHHGENWTTRSLDALMSAKTKELHIGFTVYPNPTTGFLNLSGYDSSCEYVEIYNITGMLLRTEQLNGIESAVIDLSGLPSGLILIKVGSAVEKVVFE
jgi:hypothetical protein